MLRASPTSSVASACSWNRCRRWKPRRNGWRSRRLPSCLLRSSPCMRSPAGNRGRPDRILPKKRRSRRLWTMLRRLLQSPSHPKFPQAPKGPKLLIRLRTARNQAPIQTGILLLPKATKVLRHLKARLQGAPPLGADLSVLRSNLLMPLRTAAVPRTAARAIARLLSKAATSYRGSRPKRKSASPTQKANCLIEGGTPLSIRKYAHSL